MNEETYQFSWNINRQNRSNSFPCFSRNLLKHILNKHNQKIQTSIFFLIFLLLIIFLIIIPIKIQILLPITPITRKIITLLNKKNPIPKSHHITPNSNKSITHIIHTWSRTQLISNTSKLKSILTIKKHRYTHTYIIIIIIYTHDQ